MQSCLWQSGAGSFDGRMNHGASNEPGLQAATRASCVRGRADVLLRIARGDSATSSAAQWRSSFLPRPDQRTRDTRAYWQGCVADHIMFMLGQAR